jgi:hypothetical protein
MRRHALIALLGCVRLATLSAVRAPVLLTAGLFIALLGLPPTPVGAQVAGTRFPTWRDELPQRDHGAVQALIERQAPILRPGDRPSTRSHIRTGLIIGGVVGAVATTAFLAAFCGDPDTACGADEVGRAVVLIGVPCAAAGGLIGWLVRTEE